MFVSKKRFEERINEIIERVDKLERQSNCCHEVTRFAQGILYPYSFWKECAICGKILKKYNCRLDWYEEKLSSDYKILKKEYDKMMEKKEKEE